MEQQSTLQDFIALVEAGMMAVTVYLTVTTGYLVAAYMAGANLIRSQLAIVTLLFLLFALIFAVATYLFFDAAMKLPFSDGAVGDGALGWIPGFIFVGEITGMLAAMKFMFDVRKNDQNDNKSG